jgi:hypothetical protein
MTIERACERSAAPAGGQKFAVVSTARRILLLEQAKLFRGARIGCIGSIEVAAGIKVIGLMGKRNCI